MIALLIFIALPALLITASFFIRPCTEHPSDPLGATHAANGLFGRRPDLDEPETPIVPEEDQPRPFKLD